MRYLIKEVIALQVMIALAASMAAGAHAQAGQGYGVIDLEAACGFLRNQFVESLGLLRAAYSPASTDYRRAYINDNILAVKALEICGYGDLAERVRNTLESLYSPYLRTGRHEVLLGQPIPARPLEKRDVVLGEVGDVLVVAEVRSGTELIGDYADWLFLESINSLLTGDRGRALELFEKGMSTWDGRGFRDSAFNESEGVYDTYKLGLAIYAYRALGEPPKYAETIEKILNTLTKTQDPETGGMFTGYKVVNGRIEVGSNISDRNVETTSVVILALYSNYPEEIAGLKQTQVDSQYPQYPTPTIIAAVAGTAVVAAALLIAKHPPHHRRTSKHTQTSI